MDAESWMVVFTGGLVLVGTLQLFVFGLQARRLRQTIKTMDDTAERELRAYVLPDSAGIVDGSMLTPPRVDKIGVPGVTTFIKNYGQSQPTKSVVGRKLP